MRFCDMYTVPAALAIAEAKRCRIRFGTPEIEFKYFMESLWRFVIKTLQNQCLSDQESVESPIFGRNWPENAELGLNPTEAFEKTVAAF